MAIVPTWVNRPPSIPEDPPVGPLGRIMVALRARDDVRAALSTSEQRLAAVVAEQPPHYQKSYAAFRAAGGSSAQQWQTWAAQTGQPRLHFKRLRLVEEPAA